jgi:hypothetical protein
MANVTKWGMGILLALSSVACAEQQAPRVAGVANAQVVVYMGTDTSNETDVIAVCDEATCERVAAKLNEREPGTYYVEVR